MGKIFTYFLPRKVKKLIGSGTSHFSYKKKKTLIWSLKILFKNKANISVKNAYGNIMNFLNRLL